MKILKRIAVFLLVALFAWLGYEVFTSTPLGEARDRLNGSELVTESSDITLVSPEAGSVVTSPLHVSGSAYATSGILRWAVRDEEGVIRRGGEIDLGTTEEWTDFDAEIFLPEIPDHLFTLELSTRSEVNQEIAFLETPLLASTTDPIAIQVYYIDVAKADAEEGDCAAVAFQERVVGLTDQVELLAMEELLRGPTADWARNEVPETAELVSLYKEEGVVRAHFTKSTVEEWYAEECEVSGAFEQISQTLQQFEGVTTVEIWLDGVELSQTRPLGS
jgi:hypothetical protein